MPSQNHNSADQPNTYHELFMSCNGRGFIGLTASYSYGKFKGNQGLEQDRAELEALMCARIYVPDGAPPRDEPRCTTVDTGDRPDVQTLTDLADRLCSLVWEE
jgi:hypothetical protein